MPDSAPSNRPNVWLRGLRIAIPLYPLVGGIVVLFGWVLGMPRLADWNGSGITAKANTAICCALGGTALALSMSGLWPRLVRALGTVVAAVGGLTLLEHLTGANFGIDTLLFHEPHGALSTAAPGRMGPPAATSFLILGAAIVLASRAARARRVASALALVPIALATFGIVGHLYGAKALYALAGVSGIAWQTATMIAALGIALVVALPEHGLAAALERDDPGGVMFRALLAPIVLVSIVLGGVVCLPCVSSATGEAAPAAEEVAPAADVAPPRARLRVLIADDNVDAAESLAELIEDLGHETRVANDGEAALAAAAASRPDVAFLDLGMPKLGGHEVGERIRAQSWGRDVMLVALTGWGRVDDRDKTSQMGFDEHLVKPATLEMLEKVLATADANARARSSAAPASA